MISRVLSIRDPRLRPIDRLRWRTTTVGAIPDSRNGELDNRVVPEALWADWSVRLRPRASIDFASFRVVAVTALALPGSTLAVHDLVADRGDNAAAFTAKVSHVLQSVAATSHGRAVLRGLTQLRAGLEAHGSPIDYERRRAIAAAAAPLDRAGWDRISAAADTPTGGHRKLRHARLWLWEALTAGLPHQAPAALRPEGTSGLSDYHSFALRLPAIAVNLLEEHARRVLDSHGCDNEPLVWSPPPDWVDLQGLPVPDLDIVDLARLKTLLRARRPAGDIADQLGTSLDHVRLLVRRNPDLFELIGCRPQPPRPPGKPRTQPPADLTTERLRSFVLDQKRTLRALAVEFGVGRHYLSDRLRRDGIPVPPSRRRPTVVDPEWLRLEYLEHRRTLPDIAAEIGMTPTNLARIATRHGIPLRRRGGASHAGSLTKPSGWPEPLASAMLGQGGRERMQRFQLYAHRRSLNNAAVALSVHQAVLSSQLAQLEAACGGTLIARSTRPNQRPQQLTDLGRRLLEQADRHMGPAPGPPAPPEPLATALASFWGEKRLRWFQVAARNDTLAAASQTVGSNRHSLNRSIRGLEQAVGGVLLRRTSPSHPHQLTDLGQLLLNQADDRLGKATSRMS